jgi:16S rRNA (guanine(1405)-N(7))-methyltransferase
VKALDAADADAIAHAIAVSKKYRDVYPETIRRIAADCAARYAGKEAEKRARTVLHKIWGAYFSARIDYVQALGRLAEDIQRGKDLKDCVRPVLELQPSVRERLPVLDGFYRDVFAVTGTPKSVVDHACGLNPLTVFWAQLHEECEYRAYDIDLKLVGFLNSAASLLGADAWLTAAAGDVLSGNFGYADTVFMLKLLPCLERQGRGSALKAMRKAECRHLVVSFPVRSLSGRAKGMPENYTELFKLWINNEPWTYERLLFDTELVFVVDKVVVSISIVFEIIKQNMVGLVCLFLLMGGPSY